MELQVTTLDGKASGSVTLDDGIFGLEPRTDILHRMVRYQQLKAMSGTHDVKNRSEVNLTKKKSIKQKGSGGARHGDSLGSAVPRRRPGLRSDSAQPRDRAAQEGPPAGAEACPLRQGQGRRARDPRQGREQGRQDRRAQGPVRQARVEQRADHRRRRARRELRPRRAQHSTTSTCCRFRASTSPTSCAGTSWC